MTVTPVKLRPASRRIPTRIAFILAMAITGTTFFISAEWTTVTPPSHVADPTTVILGLFGKHTSLFLPTPDGKSEEYAFGDWDYFALNEMQWWSGPRALLVSTASALGRRTLNRRTNDPNFLQKIAEPDSIILQVSTAKAESLRRTLDGRFKQHGEIPVYNSENDLENVHDDEHYALGNNCNNVTAQWLLALGCQVRGPALTSNWQLGKPAPTTPTNP